MSTSFTVKRNIYLRDNAKCSDCYVTTCSTRKNRCPYFQPSEEFTRTMLPKIGVRCKVQKKKGGAK